MRFDIADLRLFLCIVDAGSITQGALRANLALASASERLRSIEMHAGVALLERRARGVVPTAAGEALAHHARTILQQQALLAHELAGFAAGTRGTLQLHGNTSAMLGFLPRRLPPWLAAHPRLHVDLRERPSADIVRLVAGGHADAGLVSDAVDAAGLVLQPLARDPLLLLVPSAHAFARHRRMPFADALDAPFVGGIEGDALQAHVDGHATALGRRLRCRVRMKSVDGIVRMVATGVGVAVLPRSVLPRRGMLHGVRAIPLVDAWARRRLCACFRDWAALTRPMQSLLLHFGATAAETT